MLLRLNQFGGMIPRTAPHLLSDTIAQVARNCTFIRGNLTPLRENAVAVADIPETRKSIYLHEGEWLSWDTDVNVVKSPSMQDDYRRIYFTGDGTPKVRGNLNGETKLWDLGIAAPASALTITVVGKQATSWSRVWHGFYEESDGSQVDLVDLAEGVDVSETTGGQIYRLATIPAKVTASSTAKFVLWFDAKDANGNLIGRVYPQHSMARDTTSLYINGAVVTANEVDDTSGTGTTVTLTYDTSNAKNYTTDRVYVYTFLSVWGEESAPSPISAMVSVDPTQDAVLYGFPTTAPENVTDIFIYRTVTGSAGTEYQYVDRITVGTITYVDRKTDGDAGEILPSTNYTTPKADLSGLIACPGGFLAGFSANTVYFSQPYQPHAWPEEYGIPIPHDIVGLGVSGNSVIVMTTTQPYLIVGNSPASMGVVLIPFDQACVAKRSICTYANTVVYASPDGLVSIDNGNASLISERWYTRDEWQALNPASMIIATRDNLLHVFHATGSLLFSLLPEGSNLAETDDIVAGTVADPITDSLYMIQGGAIRAWDAGDTNRTARWRSKPFIMPRLAAFAAGKVDADAYPVTVRAYGDGALLLEFTVNQNRVFRLPALRPSLKWEMEIETAAAVNMIFIGGSMAEVAGAQ
jgi:hypothetical protein